MISFKVFVAHNRARGNAARISPLRAQHKVAMVLLVLLALAIAMGLSLAFAVVGLLLAVPVLIVVGVGLLLRGRRGRREAVAKVIELPPVTSSRFRRRG